IVFRLASDEKHRIDADTPVPSMPCLLKRGWGSDLVGADFATLDDFDALIAPRRRRRRIFRQGAGLVLIRSLLEFLDALAHRPTDLRQLARSEDNDDDDQHDHQFLPSQAGHRSLLLVSRPANGSRMFGEPRQSIAIYDGC